MKFFETKITPPKTKEECTAMSPGTSYLEEWAGRLDMFGIIVCVVISIFGIIMAFVDQSAYVETYNITHSGGISFHFGTFIKTLLTHALYAFIAYCSCHATALIISAIGMITYNTMVTAKASLLNDSCPKDNNTSETESRTATKDVTQMITDIIGYKECTHNYKKRYFVYKGNLSAVRIELCTKCKDALIQNGFNVIAIDNDGK